MPRTVASLTSSVVSSTPVSITLRDPAMNDCAEYNYSQVATYPTLQYVANSYENVHPYLSLVICCYGIITNIINILVLTKPAMRNSINCLLTGIAVADMITMSSYIPFTYYYYLMDDSYQFTSLAWTTFLAVHMNLTLTSHTSSIWLGVVMAAMRYFFVRPTARGAQTFDCRSTLIIIVVTFIGSALLFIPNWLVTGIKPCYHNRTGNVHWHLKTPTFGQEDGDFLHTLTFFVYPIAGKIIPITLISIFGGLLLHTLRDADQRSRRLRGGSGHGANNNGGNNQTRRTTIMLLAIIALYIISELPQSILLLLCIFVKEFFLTVYTKLGDFVDLLSLINSAINFITYIAMSTQFRNTLIQMSCACLHTSTCHKCGKTTALQSTKYSKAPPTSV